MGLWSFMKNHLGGKAEAAEAPKEAELKAGLEKMGLDTKGVELKVEGDKVTVGGKAVDAATKEKIIVAVGNTNGVAAVATDHDDDIPDAVFHTVEKGDTLSAIAQKTLGKASLYPKIFEANKPMLKDPDHIYPGQVLRIPKV